MCGDVGFGKTEVALRAAFVAVADGKQVAVLVPDHAARRAALPDLPRPLRRLAGEDRRAVALPLARRKSARRSRASPTARVDIVIGTHKLLQNGRRRSSDLGLVIIDEEHRFGVRQKEQLEGAARRGRRADAHRDADPAHAGACRWRASATSR
ncbi:MAG: DEAD/DEAH box helicase [Comamonadaceae bacterium]|nr:DEAD/DEAH box helicase [Comamonadaceae bacterium]